MALKTSVELLWIILTNGMSWNQCFSYKYIYINIINNKSNFVKPRNF